MKNKKIKIKYLDLWGLRKDKYKFLESHDVKNTKWQDLELKEPHCFFITRDTEGEEMYQDFISLKDIFLKYNAGIATGKDSFLVDFKKETLVNRLSVTNKELFEDKMGSYEIDKKLINTWYEELRKADINNQVKVYSYRPFDNRFVIYNQKILQRARQNIMDNFLFTNLGLCTTKQLSTNQFRHSLISDSFIDRCYISLQTREVTYIFPLYLYNKKELQQNVFSEGIKQTNLNMSIVALLERAYNKKFVLYDVAGGLYAIDIFYYIYGILFSRTYRKQYSEFLKIDFPRIPFTADYRIFKKMAKLGEELVYLHLVKSEKLKKFLAGFPVSTGNILTDGQVRKREYNPKEKRIYINDKQYFEGVDSEIWNYYIGGYQVLDKWLKDRIGGTLSPEDVNHYLKIISAIKYTNDLQREIDKIYPEIEENLIKIK